VNEMMRKYGVTPQDQALSTDGLTFLKKLIDGTYPAPPIAQHFTTLSPFFSRPLPSQFLHFGRFLMFGPFRLSMSVSKP